MYNPLDTFRRFQSRIGKPIRPIIELQKDASIVNILTTPVQTENLINDTYRAEGWEIPAGSRARAIYIDGLFKGMGFFAGEEGIILDMGKVVELQDKEGHTITASYKGIIGKLLDASLYERGSALKPSMMQTLIYCALFGLVAFMLGMSYGG
jgi:hypothetical protein